MSAALSPASIVSWSSDIWGRWLLARAMEGLLPLTMLTSGKADHGGLEAGCGHNSEAARPVKG
jgi:hypothetical protein